VNPSELYQAGRLDDAIQSITEEVKRDPSDSRARTFLFELLCFAGDLDRAERQLGVLALGGKEAEAGTLLYQSILKGEARRRDMFEKDMLPPSTAGVPVVGGSLNGESFSRISDADPRIGSHLEAFVGGQYKWIPFSHLESIEIQAPTRVRDLLWVPALIQALPEYGGSELGETLLPVLTPLAFRSEDPHVKLGRVTDVQELGDGRVVPAGQKLLFVDDQEVPILEVRSLTLQVLEPV